MIHLGPAGLGPEPIAMLNFLIDKGLDAAEVEFTHGVRMRPEAAKAICRENPGIKLSVHAPYFINLASPDRAKKEASIERILQSSYLAHLLGAKYVVFHPGFYMKRTEEEVYDIIKEAIIRINIEIQMQGYDVVLAPETTGKPSQFGSLQELLRLKEETGSGICIDFAHLIARNRGRIDYEQIFQKVRDLDYLHCHFSGIEYGDKGERRHVEMQRSDFLPLAREALRAGKDMTIISESPVTWEDSLKMKKVLSEIQ